MPDLKISELPSATTPLAGTEVVPVVQGGVTKKVPVTSIGGWTTVVKAADEARTSTTTMVEDDTLDIALDASSTYIFRLVAFLSTHSTPDAKYDIEYTGTTVSQFLYLSNTAFGGALGTANLASYTVEALPGSTPMTGNAIASLTFLFEGVITTDTAGSLRLRWAQNVSDSNPTTVRKGSYIEYRKV